MEGLKLGTLEFAVAHDGAIATVHKPIGVLGIPFLYESHEHAWRVYDSGWLGEFSDDMVKKTGIRMLGLADNGVRHFTNSQRPIRSPADMKGMKIRIQPSPVFKTLVESLGASASAIPWAELPTALQQKVVDGQENGVTNILAASLYQHQKYVRSRPRRRSMPTWLRALLQGLSASQIRRSRTLAQGGNPSPLTATYRTAKQT